jgi:hypothetical protein
MEGLCLAQGRNVADPFHYSDRLLGSTASPPDLASRYFVAVIFPGGNGATARRGPLRRRIRGAFASIGRLA